MTDFKLRGGEVEPQVFFQLKSETIKKNTKMKVSRSRTGCVCVKEMETGVMVNMEVISDCNKFKYLGSSIQSNRCKSGE